MEVKKKEPKVASDTTKQAFLELALEIFFSLAFGGIVTRLTGGLVLIISGPILYFFNSDQKIGIILGIAFPVIGLLMVISKIRDIKKDIEQNYKVRS